MREDWFAAKRYGYGTGLPIAWQGWAALVGYLLVMLAAVSAGERSKPVGALVMLAATGVFLWLCARHTRGGWRWRAGGEG